MQNIDPPKANKRSLPSLGLVQPAVLLLILEKSRHGYAILDELKTRGFLPQNVDAGNVYRILRRMETDGLVESSWVKAEGKGPKRRSYKITEVGKNTLYEEALELAQKAQYIELFLSTFRSVY